MVMVQKMTCHLPNLKFNIICYICEYTRDLQTFDPDLRNTLNLCGGHFCSQSDTDPESRNRF